MTETKEVGANLPTQTDRQRERERERERETRLRDRTNLIKAKRSSMTDIYTGSKFRLTGDSRRFQIYVEAGYFTQ